MGTEKSNILRCNTNKDSFHGFDKLFNFLLLCHKLETLILTNIFPSACSLI